jgi:CRP-like cAMP-binding protein
MSEKIRKLKEDASRLIAKGKIEEACECYEKVVKIDPRDLSARQKLAEIYARMGKTERAVHVYQSVAGSYAADGLLLKAIAICKMILQIDPSHTETQSILAELSTKRRGGGPGVVEMPKAMSEALASAKKSASVIRGIAANQIRGVPSSQVRPAHKADEVPLDEAPQVPERPISRVELQAGVPPVRPATTPPHAPPVPSEALGRSPQSSIEDLQRAAAAMLPDAPPAVLTGTVIDGPASQGATNAPYGAFVDEPPLVTGALASAPPPSMPPPPSDDAIDVADLPVDIPIDVEIDDAEPIILSSADVRPAAGTPINFNALLPSFDELMEMTPGESPLEAAASAEGKAAVSTEGHAIGDANNAADGADEVTFADDDADLVELSPEPAQINVDNVPPIPLFSDLPRDAFMALTERMDLRVAGVDEPLIVEGGSGDSMFVIIQGRVKVARQNDDGTETILAELSDGTFFGEMALLSDAPRTASVVCTEETMLFVISREMLSDITKQYPSVGEVMRKFHKNRLITNLLKTSPIFAPFSTSDKKALIEKFKSRQVSDGSYLITREKPGDGLYVVLSGRCEVLDARDGAAGAGSTGEVVIAELKEGDVFGEMSMLWNKETCASVRATTTCTVLRLPRAQFNEVIMTHPQILETLNNLSERRSRQNREMRSAGIASEFLL